MIRYTLSKYIRLNAIDNTYDAVPEKYSTGYFMMYNEIEDSEYLINSTIKYYIDKFSVYKTEEEALKEVETDLQSDNSLIKATCARFFNFLT